MFYFNYRRATLLALSIMFVFFSVPAFSQSIPLGGNLYGEPINGSSGQYISTSNGIYTPEPGGGYYINVYKPPDGTHIVNISLSFVKHEVIVQILHVQLSDGTVKNFEVFPNQIEYIFLSYVPTDSAEWKKLSGDAIYALGTPWSSSSPMLWVSRDSMKTWQGDTAGINGAKIQDINLDTSQYVYAATDHGLFKQNPDSNVWHKVTSFTQATNLNSIFIDRKNRILASVTGGGLYISVDNGASWNSDASGITSGQVSLMTDDAFGNLFAVVSTSFFGGAHIYKSTGGNSLWQFADSSISRIVTSTSFQNMQINSINGDSTLIAGTSFGVFLSTNQGTTWRLNNNGIRAENISGMAKTNSGKVLLSTALGIFSNTPPDTSWNKTYPQNGFEGQLRLYSDEFGNIYTLDPEILIPSGKGATAVIKSTDGGTSWSPDTTGLSAVTGGQIFYIDEAGDQYSAGYKFPTSNMYLWTKPMGGSWTIDTTGFPTQNSYPISMTSDHNGYLYISGTISSKKVMRRQMSGGAWSADTSGIPQSVSFFGNMVPGKSGDVYGVVGYYGPGVMRRSGGTWSSFPSPPSLSSQYVTGISVDNSGAVFVAFADYYNASLGAYFTTDQGTSWTHAGLDSVYVTSLVSFGDSTYALSSNAGAFFVGKNPVTAVKQQSGIPNSFALFQNYPNPFNPTTAIRYQLSAISHVTLKIYDILGREVTTLVDEKENAGTHQIRFDGTRFASGVYFYRLEAKSEGGMSFMQTKKLVLIK